MRIVFISTGHPVYDIYPSGGGIQYQIYGLARALADLGHEVTIIKRYMPQVHIEDENVDFIDVKAPLEDDVVSVLLFSLRAREVVKRLRPDCIYLSGRFSAHFIADLPFVKVFKLHNYDALGFYRDFAVEYNRLNILFFPVKQRIERRVMELADMVLVTTKSYKRYMHLCGLRGVRVLPNAIDASTYHDAGDRGFVLYAGRLNRVKGVDCLIKAFRGIERDFPKYKLLIVGNGPDGSRLRTLADGSDRVMFVEWLPRSRYIQILSRCSLFVLPSFFESFGNVLLEAMACGKTVITSDIMGPRDLISDRYDGLLFRAGDSKQLENLLRLCLGNEGLRRKIGRRAEMKVRSTYTFEKVAPKLLENLSVAL